MKKRDNIEEKERKKDKERRVRESSRGRDRGRDVVLADYNDDENLILKSHV